MRFKEFVLNESGGTGNLPANAFGVGTKHDDAWGLDTVDRKAIGANHYPSGGFQSVGQITQHVQNLGNIQDPDYINQSTLSQLATFVDNVIVGIDNNTNGTGHYKMASYNNGKPGSNPQCPRDWIQGLAENDIISGLFPRLKHEDMQRGMKMNIIIRRPQNNNIMLFDINVGVLREAMKENAEKISHKQVKQGLQQHVAQGADTFLNQINQGTMPLSTSANPWNAG